jgi:hypothetical protein
VGRELKAPVGCDLSEFYHCCLPKGSFSDVVDSVERVAREGALDH